MRYAKTFDWYCEYISHMFALIIIKQRVLVLKSELRLLQK